MSVPTEVPPRRSQVLDFFLAKLPRRARPSASVFIGNIRNVERAVRPNILAAFLVFTVGCETKEVGSGVCPNITHGSTEREYSKYMRFILVMGLNKPLNTI